MKYITSLSIIIICILVFFASILLPDRKTSVVENRSLAGLPSFTAQKLFSGDFRNETDRYISDQMPLRDLFIKAYLKLSTKKNNIPNANYKQMVEGKQGFNYYLYDENLILSLYSQPKIIDVAYDWANKIKEINDAAKQKSIPLFVDFVPSKAEALNDMLPEVLAGNSDKEITKLIYSLLPRDIKIVDTPAAFEKMSVDEKKTWYLNTDHHWNAKGSFEGFKILCSALESSLKLNISIGSNDFAFTKLDVPNFVGSYNQNLGFMFPRNESIGQLVPVNKNALSALSLEIGRKSAITVERIDPSKIFKTRTSGENVTYASVFNDNYGLLHLSNPNAKNNFKLLVLKDSYFNALIPNLSCLISDIYVIDTRYAPDFVLSDFIENNPCDAVLMFYNTTAYLKVDEQLSFRVK